MEFFYPGTAEIRTLIQRLPHNSLLREWAQMILDGNEVPADCVPLLLSILKAPPSERWWKPKALNYWREQAVAYWMLGQLPIMPEQREAVVQALCDVLWRKPSSRNMGLRYCLISAVLGPIAGALFVGSLLSFPLTFAQTACNILLFLVFTIWMALLPQCVQIEQNNNRVIHRIAIASLGKLSTLLSVEALVATSLEKGLGVRELARDTLGNVVPTLSEEHYGHLKSQTIPNLCHLLEDPTTRASLIRQVLEALGKVGDGRAVAPVAALAKREHDTLLGKAAEKILPILRERKRMEEAPRNLLRASEQPTASPDVLLRPAMDTADPQPEQLLRAGSSPTKAEGSMGN